MPPNKKLTRVDGIGLWRSWTRNFNTKTLALLDLIDNSLDAAIHNGGDEDDDNNNNSNMHSFRGKVHVYPDIVEEPGGRPTTTGLCIVNNAMKKIRPLKNVLEVYNSSKVHSGAGDIGENGVGLKQGCATLSDLSFVLMKNGDEKHIELGIIAKDLQRLDGCYLPAFHFTNEKRSEWMSLRDQMISFFSDPSYADVAKCIAKYGAPRYESERNLAVGVDRLCRHFNRKAFDDPYVFMVILDKIHHDQAEEYIGNQVDAQQKITVNRLMKELTEVIPRTYLHVPQSFSFMIGEQRIIFDYWPRRLIELTTIKVDVNKKIPWQNKIDLPNHQQTYPMRVFLGFDGMRVTTSSTGREASLYIYSRQCGRLISHHADARTRLGLSAGGSDYCQGLTVIIDDYGGNLPLNPTKQEVAFGEESNGTTHEENLMAWVGCVAQFYYQVHLQKFGGKKTILTKEITDLGDELDKHDHLKPLDDSNLTTYSMSFKKSAKNIRVDKSSVEEFVGSDTIFRLCPKTKKTTKSTTAADGRKRKADTSASSAPPIKRKAPASPPPLGKTSRQKQPVLYAEDESNSAEAELNSDDEDEGENGYDPLPQFNGAPPAVVRCNPRNSTTTTTINNAAVKQEHAERTHQYAVQAQLPSDQRDFKRMCDELTVLVKKLEAQNQDLREENIQLRQERNRTIALGKKVGSLQAEIAALTEENKSLRGKSAKLELDYHRLEFLVKEKTHN